MHNTSHADFFSCRSFSHADFADLTDLDNLGCASALLMQAWHCVRLAQNLTALFLSRVFKKSVDFCVCAQKNHTFFAYCRLK
jgi:hypothetical protein